MLARICFISRGRLPANSLTRLVRVLGSYSYVRLFVFKRLNTEGGIQAPAQSYLMAKYNTSFELASSGLSLYVLGFAMGPLICVYFTSCIKSTRGLLQEVT
jgi:hypothetical protein